MHRYPFTGSELFHSQSLFSLRYSSRRTPGSVFRIRPNFCRRYRPSQAPSTHHAESLVKVYRRRPLPLRESELASRRQDLRPKKISLARLPITGSDVFGREEDIAFLDDAWANKQVNVVTIVAWGGVGKSTLVNHWLRRMAAEQLSFCATRIWLVFLQTGQQRRHFVCR